jgi:nicotinate phosphoribosyltransferase
MNMKPIIVSLLDNDAYTFYMCQFILSRFKGTIAKYKYKCRNGNGFPAGLTDEKKYLFVSMMNSQIDSLCELKFNEAEIAFLRGTGKFKEEFLDFLRTLTLDRSHIKCTCRGGGLYIEIEGPIEKVIWYETPILAINSELYYRYYDVAIEKYVGSYQDNFKLEHRFTLTNSERHTNSLNVAREKLQVKINEIREASLPGFNIVDFGTRRRATLGWQDEVLTTLKKEVPSVLKGTSNCYLAMKHDLPIVGTMAHQLFQMYQQMAGATDCQTVLLSEWQREYGDQLLIALSDIFGFEAFLADFVSFAQAYTGTRHDSANPYIWCEKLLAFYKKLNIVAGKKTAVFSDGLTVTTALQLYATFYKRINVAIAIGTNLTNDTDVGALQIVIKLVEFNHGPVAKVSDSPGKGMCESYDYEEYINYIVAQKERRYKQWLENK